MDRCPELTAIFALSDVIAVGVIRALHDRGLRVPEDVSVMGYDGVPIGEFIVPRLTTVRQDIGTMARLGADTLLRQMNERQAPTYDYVPFFLVEGESVGPCRA
jgi:LacI family transcriptional regulator